MQRKIFGTAIQKVDLRLPGSPPALHLDYWETVWTEDEQRRLFERLLQDVEWRQEAITLFGRRVNLPRMTAWYGDTDARYKYSGIINEPMKWTDDLAAVKERVEEVTGERFNGALLNLYRSGHDHMSWHSDDEAEIDQEKGMASVTFGAARRFQFRRKDKQRAGDRFEIRLQPGSLLYMHPSTQEFWEHRVPKEAGRDDARVNLTFRFVRS